MKDRLARWLNKDAELWYGLPPRLHRLSLIGAAVLVLIIMWLLPG